RMRSSPEECTSWSCRSTTRRTSACSSMSWGSGEVLIFGASDPDRPVGQLIRSRIFTILLGVSALCAWGSLGEVTKAVLRDRPIDSLLWTVPRGLANED